MAEESIVVGAQKVLLEEQPGVFSIEPAAIEIKGGRILAVHRSGSGAPAPALTHDFGPRLLAPAFIDAHTHLALSFLRGADAGQAASGRMVEDLFYRMESRLTAEDVRAFTRMGAYESLLSGVGLVYDHYYYAEAVAEGLSDVGLAAVIAPTLQDLSGPGVDQLDAQMAATQRIASSSKYAAEGVFAAVGPHAGDTVSGELWTRAAEFAKELNVPMHAHIAQSPQEWSAVVEREGVPPLGLLERLGVTSLAPKSLFAHGLYATRAELEGIPKDRVTFAFCPHSQLVFGFPASVSRWRSMGISFVVATDCGASNDSLSLQKELRFLAGSDARSISDSAEYERYFEGGVLSDPGAVAGLRQRRIRDGEEESAPERILQRVLSHAGSLHPAFVAGRIVPGALANLLVVDLDHPNLWPPENLTRALVYSDVAPAIHSLIVGGRIIGKPGEFHRSILRSDSYRDAHDEASGRLRALFAR